MHNIKEQSNVHVGQGSFLSQLHFNITD